MDDEHGNTIQVNEIAESDVKTITEIFSRNEMRTVEGLVAFEQYLENHPLNEGVDFFPLFHQFADGAYTREIHLKKGYVLTGRLHKKEAIVHMMTGKILVADVEGVRILEAPLKFVSKSGGKRVGYILEDSVWIDIYSTEKDNILEAEEELFCEKPEDLDSDFGKMVNSIGFTEEEVRRQSENKADLIEFPEETIITIRGSVIEGKGAFLTKDVPFRGTIGTARVESNRTPLGRYTNHAFNPNAKPVVENGVIYFEARKGLSSGEEVTVDYREVIKAAESLDKRLTICQAQ